MRVLAGLALLGLALAVGTAPAAAKGVQMSSSAIFFYDSEVRSDCRASTAGRLARGRSSGSSLDPAPRLCPAEARSPGSRCFITSLNTP
jgi:hypothetical protein